MSGATQQAVMLPDATNANMKIFWLTAVDNVSSPKTFTVSVAPTGLTAGVSTGKIGGRLSAGTAATNGATAGVNVLRAGDTAIVNNAITQPSGVRWDIRANGTFAAPITIRGATGSRPRITQAGNVLIIAAGASGTNGDFSVIQSLELEGQGTAAAVTSDGNSNANGVRFIDCVVVDAGGVGIGCYGSGGCVLGCHVYGTAGDGIDLGGSASTGFTVEDCYVHDVTGHGIDFGGASGATSTGAAIRNNLVERCGSNGIHALMTSASGVSTQAFEVSNNTVYRCSGSGIKIDDKDVALILKNNIVKDNGNVGTEYNVELIADTTIHQARNNCFSIAGGLGGGNVSNYTLDSTDITGDPLFVDPDNASAASRDFSLNKGSPARATGFPGAFLGSGTTGYPDMGAVQSKAAGSILRHPGMSGGMNG